MTALEVPVEVETKDGSAKDAFLFFFPVFWEEPEVGAVKRATAT
jgi:hypothetical protein